MTIKDMPSHQISINNIDTNDIPALKAQCMSLTRDLEEQTAAVSSLEERHQNMARYLREDTESIKSSIKRQHNISDIGTSWDFMRAQPRIILMQALGQNTRLRHEMEEQEKIIQHLTQYHSKAMNEFGKYTTTMMSKLEEQTKTIAELQGKTRIVPAQEKREKNMKEVLDIIAGIMFSELEYQQELIDELKTDDEQYFQPTHNTLLDLVGVIEQWAVDDEYPEMIFKLEDDESQMKQRNEELGSQVDDLSHKLKLQSMKVNGQQNLIKEQANVILELEVQKRRLAGDLEAVDEQLASMLEIQGKNALSQTEQKHNEQENSMKCEIEQLNHRLGPLEDNLFNVRQAKFCNYLRANGSIGLTEANIMFHNIDQIVPTISMAEVDARMFEKRLGRLSGDYIPDFVRVYGVLPSKILNSSQ
ncbi:hypothetical protein N7457_009368 [Penicillium paradoxum]|uniref:uncharacterized protein n=1 Tax=Penicillium paradoxum TaxID=176176 RepID=UPI0025497F04|nr:uncharacterized protein N7457_009368 [Penicillium paradoxum]KAJ5774472.1 hypothetical protein N7457_009368 [Penicillium paradoxum]